MAFTSNHKLMQSFLLLLVVVGGASETITGNIYCDNYFEFYFNGVLIKKDPMTFTPHNSVEVSFEWDGVSDKQYAIMCQDFATSSGYEYTLTDEAQLGDGALIASFSDGTLTNPDWQSNVVKYGPTKESEAAGCSATNLEQCVVADSGEPADWFSPDFDYSGWDFATVYTADEAGWGRPPKWVEGSGCCTATSPLTREDLTLNGGCSVNYDLESGTEVTAEVVSSDCIDPRGVFQSGDAASAVFLWGAELQKDNKMLFRYTAMKDAPTVRPELTRRRPACTQRNQCNRCEGDCDNNRHCAGNLMCFQRFGSTRFAEVPGCSGTGGRGLDYCYDPADV